MLTHHTLTALSVPDPPEGFLPFGFRVEPVARPGETPRERHHLFHTLADARRYVAEEGTCRTKLVALAVSGEARVQSEWNLQTAAWGDWLPD